MDGGPVVATAESPTAGTNPLAGLLGYGVEDDEEPVSPPARPAKPDVGGHKEAGGAALQGTATATSSDGKDLDAEVCVALKVCHLPSCTGQCLALILFFYQQAREQVTCFVCRPFALAAAIPWSLQAF